MKSQLITIRHASLKTSSTDSKYTNCMLKTEKIYRAMQTSIKERLLELSGRVSIYRLQAVLDF